MSEARAASKSRADFEAISQVERLVLDLQLSCLDLGIIENIVDDRQQGVAAVTDDLRVFGLFGRQRRIEQQPGHADHRVHGSADFVAHRGEKLRFRECGRFRRFFGLPQFLFRLLTRRNVRKGDARALNHAVFDDRGRGIFYRKTGAVAPPEDLVIEAAGLPVLQHSEDRALLGRILCAIRVMMVRQLVHILAEDFVGRVAQHSRARPIDIGTIAVSVYAVNAFFSRVHQETAVTVQFQLLAFR